jgi:hypothetical protein
LNEEQAMKKILIAIIAGLGICFAGDFTPSAEARPWRRAYRNYRQYDRQYDRYDRNYGYYGGYGNRYYAPRSYYYPRYGYRTFRYPNYYYGWSSPRGGIYFSF